MVTYQFDEEEHTFNIKSHANSKEKTPYRRTQDSTFKAIETKVVVEKPRQVFQSVAESSGDGLFKGTQPSAWPRDMAQIYNIKKQQKKKLTSTGSDNVCANDPYFALILQCKEDEANPKTSFVRRVTTNSFTCFGLTVVGYQKILYKSFQILYFTSRSNL